MFKKAISFIVASFIVIVLTQGVYASNQWSDGQYDIQLKILKSDSDELSRMNDYVENKAQLNIANGKKSVLLTLKDSSSITGFKVEKNGNLADTKVVSSNQQLNTRTVEFDVENFEKPLNAWVSVYISMPGFLYDHEYDVQVSLDKNSIQEKQVAVPQVTAPSESTQSNIILYLNSKKAQYNHQSITLQESPYTKNDRTLFRCALLVRILAQMSNGMAVVAQ